MYRAISALLLVAVLPGLGTGCSSTPEDYDYHGGPVDVPDSEAWRLQDVGPLVEGGGVGEAGGESGGPGDMGAEGVADVGMEDGGTGQDFPADQHVVVERVRKCVQELSAKSPDGSALFVAGEFTSWQNGQLAMQDDDGDGTWELELDMSGIAAGSYGYKFHSASDAWFMDGANPLSKWVDGIENSKLLVPDCAVPELKMKDLKADGAAGEVVVTIEVYNPASSGGVLPASAKLLVNGKEHDSGFSVEDAAFHVSLDGVEDGTKVSLRASIENEAGRSEELYLPVWVESEPWSWRDATIYFAFTDRFENGEGANDGKAGCTDKDITNWNGGDFQGIVDRIESGWFKELGVDVLWISPVVDNPDGCFGDAGMPGVSFTAFHGYFPLDFTKCENHFGDMEALRKLVDTAHAHGMRVLLDLVANHVHEDSAEYSEHAGDGWFHPFYACKPNWDKPIECWFEPYLPDLDYTNDAVVEHMLGNAVWWVLETGVDGFRVDAVKHMVHNFMKSLRWHIGRRVETTGVPFYMVGETFMGEWGGGTGQAETVIKEYVNEWELNGQFDFPFYWKVLRSAAREKNGQFEGDFKELASFLEESLGYWGAGAMMVSFVGNHDVPRILSHAAGQIENQWGDGSKMQGLTAPPGLPGDAVPFDKAKVALGLMLTLPEIPMIYYGDEVGLPGAGDPDNRRPMLFEGLAPGQEGVLEFVRKAGKARRELGALRRGVQDCECDCGRAGVPADVGGAGGGGWCEPVRGCSERGGGGAGVGREDDRGSDLGQDGDGERGKGEAGDRAALDGDLCG